MCLPEVTMFELSAYKPNKSPGWLSLSISIPRPSRGQWEWSRMLSTHASSRTLRPVRVGAVEDAHMKRGCDTSVACLVVVSWRRSHMERYSHTHTRTLIFFYYMYIYLHTTNWRAALGCSSQDLRTTVISSGLRQQAHVCVCVCTDIYACAWFRGNIFGFSSQKLYTQTHIYTCTRLFTSSFKLMKQTNHKRGVTVTASTYIDTHKTQLDANVLLHSLRIIWKARTHFEKLSR